MPLNKSRGNMYPWVTHTHSHLIGKCPHGCSYCYVQSMERRFKLGKFCGTLGLNEAELEVDYGAGNTIFVEHQNDLFAEGVPEAWVAAVMDHCDGYPENTYVFQSKNPAKMISTAHEWPLKVLLGTTIESNRHFPHIMGTAPKPAERMAAVVGLGAFTFFVTVEPILDFDVSALLNWLKAMSPRFVNLGADSKGWKLPEPPKEKVLALIDGLEQAGISVREKHNLDRLLA